MAQSSLRLVRLVLWLFVAILGLGAAGFFIYTRSAPPAIAGIGEGSYTLEQADGTAFTEASLTGKPSLLFFGFTHCPDVCPTTLGEMSFWFEQLGPDAERLNAWFVTVDPERDTPEIVGDYVAFLEGKVIAVTGSRAETDRMMQAWRIIGEKVGDGDDYTVNHTASVYLVDAAGDFVGTIAYEEDMQTALAKIRRLLAV